MSTSTINSSPFYPSIHHQPRPISVLLNGFEYQWQIIFSFAIASKREYMNMLLISKHLHNIMFMNDDYLCWSLVAFLFFKTENRYELPSLSFLRSKRAAHILKKNFATIRSPKTKTRKIRSGAGLLKRLLLYGDQGAKYMELLKYISWSVEDARSNAVCPAVATLGKDCKRIVKLLKLKEVKKINKLLVLLDKYRSYCATADFGVDGTIAHRCYEIIHKKRLNFRQVFLAAAQYDHIVLKMVSGELREDLELFIEVVRWDARALRHCPDYLRDNKDVVMEAVRTNGRSLGYASIAVRNQRDVVLLAVKQVGLALKYASGELQNDREVVMTAIRANGRAIKYASTELKEDREIVLAAVRQNGRALKYINNNASDLNSPKKQSSKSLKNVFKSLKRALINTGTLPEVKESFKYDKEIILEAVKTEGDSLLYASSSLRNDRDVVFEAVNKRGGALAFASDSLRNNREIVLAAIRQDPMAICYASDLLKDDRSIIMEAVARNGLALQYASSRLKKKKQVVLAAVSQSGLAIAHASSCVKKEPEIIEELSKQEEIRSRVKEIRPLRSKRSNTTVPRLEIPERRIQ